MSGYRQRESARRHQREQEVADFVAKVRALLEVTQEQQDEIDVLLHAAAASVARAQVHVDNYRRG